MFLVLNFSLKCKSFLAPPLEKDILLAHCIHLLEGPPPPCLGWRDLKRSTQLWDPKGDSGHP